MATTYALEPTLMGIRLDAVKQEGGTNARRFTAAAAGYEPKP